MANEHRFGKVRHARHQEIQALALGRGGVEVAELAQRFDVSTETIRRDLSMLQHEGLLRRVHGGAVPTENAEFVPFLTDRDRMHRTEKRRIGQLALEQLGDASTVLIDSGSTTGFISAQFPKNADIHLITNSLRGALTLTSRGIQQLTVLGGSVVTNTMAMVDQRGIAMVQALNVDLLFIGCDGLSLSRGMTTPDLNEAMLKSAMIRAAGRVVAVIDHSKLDSNHLYAFADFADLDVLITDTGAEPAAIEAIGSHGIDVLLA